MHAPAMLLAAGLGTRLRPLTNHRPKPLVPVCGAPMLDHALALLRQHGMDSALVNAYHLPEQIQAWAARQSVDLEVVVEAPQILGTGGGLRNVRERLDASVVVLNGDTLCDVDLSALRAALTDDVDAVMVLRRLLAGEPYLPVLADSEDRVVDLIGLAVAPLHGALVPGTHFTGVHTLRRSVLDLLPPGESCIVRQGYVQRVPQRRVATLLHAGTWFDVGTPGSYLRANLLALSGALRLPLDPLAGAAWAKSGTQEVGSADAVSGASRCRFIPPFRIDPEVTLGEGANIGPNVVIGARARVGPNSTLSNCVVWDACQVPSNGVLEGAVVHDGGILSLSPADFQG